MGRNIDDFTGGNARGIWGDFVDRFGDAQLVVANLECPLVDTPSPIEKVGKNFMAPSGCVLGIRNAGIHVLTLANNHIMDQGAPGLESTLSACRKAGIATVGGGANLEEAGRPFRAKRDGFDIVISGCAESEFSIAGESKHGANPLSVIDIWRKHGKVENPEFHIYLLHAGREHYPLPSPKLQDTCRFIVEQGAKVVICQHSHCIGTYEEYKGGLIVYGQGNFVFDRFPDRAQTWYEGVLVELTVFDDNRFDFEFAPYRQYDETPGVVALEPSKRGPWLDGLSSRSKILRDKKRLTDAWREHCRAYKHKYMSILRGHGGILKQVNNTIHLTDLQYRKHSLRYLLNTIRCETHKELLETILEMENE